MILLPTSAESWVLIWNLAFLNPNLARLQKGAKIVGVVDNFLSEEWLWEMEGV